MKWKYKSLMFLVLMLFCVGSVCATDPDPTDPFVKKLIDDNAELNIKFYNQSKEINHLKDNNTQLNNRVKALEDSNKRLEDSNKVLISKVDNQTVIINDLQADNKALNSKVDNQSITIKELKESNKVLEDSNKVLISKVDNQTVIINELKNKLDIQLNENNELQAEKDKLNIEIKQLNAEKCSIYEKLLESPKKEDYEQLKKDIANKDNKIKELNTKIKILNNILNINKKDVVNSLKALSSSTNYNTIKCGKYTFKLEDYLKIPLIRDGKNNVLKFKKDNGRLPNHVTIAGYKVPQKVYKKLFNI